MSVLWEQKSEGRRVEVRGHGRTRRLYVDGVLHTEWNPGRALTGSVWDPLALAALAHPAGAVRRVLVLGVGGGAAIQLLRRHVGPEQIVGVELDPVLLEAGRRWFDLEGDDLDLVHGDAVAWVRRRRALQFDMVLDDLFVEEDGEPVRAPGVGPGWFDAVARLVAPGGLLVVNFPERRDLETSDLCQDLGLRRRFPAALRFSFPAYLNAPAALLPEDVSPARFRAAVRRLPALQTAAALRYLRFGVHRLWPR